MRRNVPKFPDLLFQGGSSIATSPVLEESPDPTFIINYTHYYHVCYDFHVCIIQIIYV